MLPEINKKEHRSRICRLLQIPPKHAIQNHKTNFNFEQLSILTYMFTYCLPMVFLYPIVNERCSHDNVLYPKGTNKLTPS